MNIDQQFQKFSKLAGAVELSTTQQQSTEKSMKSRKVAPASLRTKFRSVYRGGKAEFCRPNT